MVGSAWMPWLRPMVGVSLCSKRALLERGQQRVEIGEQQVGGAHQLHVEAGVEHVGGGEPHVHEARLGPDVLGQVRQEGDDVVLDLALDGVDAGDVEPALRPLSQMALAALFGDQPQLGHGGRPRAPRSRTRCESASREPRFAPSAGRV